MGRRLIGRFLARYRSAVVVVVVVSVLANFLVFAGSIYMVLVYDSVLPSRSLPTLLGLFGILAVLYLCQGLFEIIRGEALLATANGVHNDLFQPVDHASVSMALAGKSSHDGMQLVRDLDQIHSYLASPGPAALLDLPWALVFLLVLGVLHWSLGVTALAGVLVLAVIALATSRRTDAGTRDLVTITGRRVASTQAELRNAEVAKALGMRGRLLFRSSSLRSEFLDAQSLLSRTVSRLGGAGRVFRLFLQSLILTVGAYLVINDRASGGVILASSVLAGRALAPVDLAIANWRGFASAKAGWARIVEAISAFPLPSARGIGLAAPTARLEIRDLWVVPPGSDHAVVSGVSLSLQAGQALAIIGPSAAGKTSLAKAIAGIWPASRGEVRLDGATHDQWDEEAIGAAQGYLPQSVELIDGTIGQNIARFDPAATSEAVIAAACKAGLHEIILGLRDGYDTRVSGGGVELSAGQRQRLGLARALYGDPFLLVLDEPNSNLDAAGDAALGAAIEGVRQRGGIVVMITHRPATLAPVSHVAVLTGGRLSDFGERDAVLQRLAAPPGSPAKPRPVMKSGAPAPA